jgi:hypothetical protein
LTAVGTAKTEQTRAAVNAATITVALCASGTPIIAIAATSFEVGVGSLTGKK